MITIDYKSTGTLLNEFITANLKFKYIGEKPEFRQRIEDLTEALSKRDVHFTTAGTDRFNLVAEEFSDLEVILDKLWWAVEASIKLRDADRNDLEAIKTLGFASVEAFELNAERCNIIRDMDNKLGEGHVTFLEKSY